MNASLTILFVFFTVFSSLQLVAQDEVCDAILLECLEQSPITSTSCTTAKLAYLLRTKIKYPSIALENGKEGSMVFQILVSSSGDVENISLVHYFDESCIKASKKILKSKEVWDLKFSEIACEGEEKSIKISVPIEFFIESSKASSLWEMDDIFCNSIRNKEYHYKIRLKNFKKLYKRSNRINEMWKYELGLAEFKDFSFKVIRSEKEVFVLNDLVDLNDPKLAEVFENIEKKDLILFVINERVGSQSVEKQRKILIK